ncbi:MAG: hypothetical protein MUE70_00850 [Desulfobacterales bacterium]|jgi:hypothetical protein|nr:hypothetical protein [Desulfobacterales bacterium]
MRKWSKCIALAMMAFMIAGGVALAANGSCQANKNSVQAKNQACKGAALRPCLLIINGDPVTVSGTVYEALYAGQGLTVDTGEGLVTVYGFGPQWYWDLLGVDKPDVGEEVEIEAVAVKFSDGTEKIIAISITIGDDAVELRDENGRPMWRCKGRLL